MERHHAIGPALACSNRPDARYSALPLPPDSCDQLILRSGEKLRTRIIEITAEDVRHAPCDKPRDVHSVKASQVIEITFANGRKQVFAADSMDYARAGAPEGPPPKPVDGFAVASLILAVIGWVLPISKIPLAAISFIAFLFGCLGLNKTTGVNSRHSGKVLSIVSMLLSAAGVVVALILL